jgi:hypothetical protein
MRIVQSDGPLRMQRIRVSAVDGAWNSNFLLFGTLSSSSTGNHFAFDLNALCPQDTIIYPPCPSLESGEAVQPACHTK